MNKHFIPAEWEVDGDILMAWPHADTDWADMLDEVQECYINIIRSIVASGRRVLLLVPPGCSDSRFESFPSDLLIRVDYLTNDTWTRDYGPISFGDGSYADFQFNGWGLKFASDRDNLATIHLRDSGLLGGNCEPHLDFVLEGGGIESDGRGTILTTSECIMSVNRNGGRFNPLLRQQLSDSLRAERVLYVDHGYLAGDDTDSHIDTLARLAPNDTILYVECQNTSDEHYIELAKMREDLEKLRTADGLPYTLIGLPMPDPIYDEDGQRLPATYANFLVTPDALFLPVYGQQANDKLAEQIVRIAFDMPVYTIDCRALIKQHGSLHCATMQIPKQLIRI